MTDAPYIRPDMKAFLDMMAQVSGPKMVDMTLEEARDSYIKMHGIADRPARAPQLRLVVAGADVDGVSAIGGRPSGDGGN